MTNALFMQLCSFEIFYFLSHLFAHTTFCKPVASRPATGEVYLVFKGFRNDMSIEERQGLVDSLWKLIDKNKSQTTPRKSLFSFSDNESFRKAFDYCKDVNDSLIWHQLQACYAIQQEYLKTFGNSDSVDGHNLTMNVQANVYRLNAYFSSAARCEDPAHSDEAESPPLGPQPKKRREERFQNDRDGYSISSTISSEFDYTDTNLPSAVLSGDYYSYWSLYELQEQL